MRLPDGIRDVDEWGCAIIETGKLAKYNLAYMDMMESASAEVSQYRTYLMTQVNRADLTPAMKDLVRYVHVRQLMSCGTSTFFEGSLQPRKMKINTDK